MTEIERLDHIVLTVADIDATCAFYESTLGMQRVEYGEGRVALAFGNQKINLHQAGKEHEPKAKSPATGSGDLCFVAGTPLDELVDHLKSLNILILEGPVARTGALGKMVSIYFRDPDGNLIEVSNYL